MYKGSVDFVAEVRANGLKFPRFEFNPNEQGVDKVEIELPNGMDLKSVVHLACVASTDERMALAIKVNTAALNRIAFFHNVAIENDRSTGGQFSLLSPQPGAPVLVAAPGGYWCTGNAAKLTVGRTPQTLRPELEQPPRQGEHYYGLFRSARQSIGPVEEFMHLYNILLMLFNDKQRRVDDFIRTENPSVHQTQHPREPPGVMETVYSCLRNEFAHPREGVNVNTTKAKMESCLADLRNLTRRAIELHS